MCQSCQNPWMEKKKNAPSGPNEYCCRLPNLMPEFHRKLCFRAQIVHKTQHPRIGTQIPTFLRGKHHSRVRLESPPSIHESYCSLVRNTSIYAVANTAPHSPSISIPPSISGMTVMMIEKERKIKNHDLSKMMPLEGNAIQQQGRERKQLTRD